MKSRGVTSMDSRLGYAILKEYPQNSRIHIKNRISKCVENRKYKDF